MATFNYTNHFVSGGSISASELQANFDDARNFLVSTKLDTGNLQTPYTNEVFNFSFDSISSGASEVRRFDIPAGITVVWTEAQVAFESGSGATVSLQFTDDGTNVLSSTLTQSTAATVASSTGFGVSSSEGGSTIVVTVSASGATASNVTATLWNKQLLRS
ncbi:MAG: hypothetical protein CMM54_00475 [Rhodospirillaceae bacterium]|nr:hypothetical protein [Rhodospirillaceae bacterium]|tara:strand:+ start:10294 stop:10776 length:483 start_codon:yes stop_codon:yes gene_type:complete